MKEITHSVQIQNENRRLRVENDTPEGIIAMIFEEAVELKAQLQESYVTGDVMGFAMELGDMGYLLVRLCNLTGLSLEQVIEIKLTRNAMKYSDHIMSNGRALPEAVRVSKEVWSAMGGDQRFSHAYLEYLAQD